MVRIFRLLVVSFCLALTPSAQAGMTSESAFTERGKTDFDTFLQLLNPYGKWSKIGDKWAFTPTDHETPYTNGRWVYTEYGWYWKGNHPHSWATEHYGYWKRSADKVWSWYPAPDWLPEIVELRDTPEAVGWRSGEVDESGNFVEEPSARFAKEDEWTFVSRAQFVNPITPAVLDSPAETKKQLEDSTDSHHTYLTYREIDRPGPHPADVAELSKDGGALAPVTIRDRAEAAAPKPPRTNAAAAHMSGTNAPTLIGAETDPDADTRKVKYWVSMSLPTYWTKPPADAKAGELYIYRPELFQDQDGIQRRITLWFNPNARTKLKDVFAKNRPAIDDDTDKGGPATPAVPVVAPSGRDPFASPLDAHSHTASAGSNSRSTNTPSTGPVPSGLAKP